MKFYEKLFAGTYFLVVKFDNRGVVEFNSFLAWNSLLAIICFHVVFVSGCFVWLGLTHLMLRAEFNIIAGLFAALIGWRFLISEGRYIKSVKRFLGVKRGVTMFATYTYISMSLVFFTAGIFAIVVVN